MQLNDAIDFREAATFTAMQFSDSDLSDADSDLDAELERDFPLGDGTADTDVTVACPYCGEAVVIALDPGSGGQQDYVEDCEVCCQPWRVAVTYRADGSADVSVSALDA